MGDVYVTLTSYGAKGVPAERMPPPVKDKTVLYYPPFVSFLLSAHI